jgi:hypothetical protein
MLYARLIAVVRPELESNTTLPETSLACKVFAFFVEPLMIRIEFRIRMGKSFWTCRKRRCLSVCNLYDAGFSNQGAQSWRGNRIAGCGSYNPIGFEEL